MIQLKFNKRFPTWLLGSAFLWGFLGTDTLAQELNHRLEIHPLTDSVYVFTTYRSLDGQPFPANGMYIVSSAGVVLIDTPWDSTQFQPLLDTIQTLHHLPVVLVLATHSHNDRTGGLGYYNSVGIPTYTSWLTDQICQQRGEKRARSVFINDTSFLVGNTVVKTFYPGPGHTPDNLVVWFPSKKVLYGGCFIKSTEAGTLGNLSDANPKTWVKSLYRLNQTFPHPDYVVPGHQGWGDPGAVRHTIKLARAYNKNHN